MANSRLLITASVALVIACAPGSLSHIPGFGNGEALATAKASPTPSPSPSGGGSTTPTKTVYAYRCKCEAVSLSVGSIQDEKAPEYGKWATACYQKITTERAFWELDTKTNAVITTKRYENQTVNPDFPDWFGKKISFTEKTTPKCSETPKADLTPCACPEPPVGGDGYFSGDTCLAMSGLENAAPKIDIIPHCRQLSTVRVPSDSIGSTSSSSSSTTSTTLSVAPE